MARGRPRLITLPTPPPKDACIVAQEPPKDRGDWIQTYTGIKFHPLDPQVQDIDINDIAHSLSNKCRYSGHCKKFYSVAEHSVYVSQYVARESALWGLLHDAGEAYLADVPRPIKPYLVGFSDLEATVMRVICQRFQIEAEEPEEVSRVDASMLADEMPVLMGKPAAPWDLPYPPLGVRIRCLAPEDAKNLFMQRFSEICRMRAFV